MKKILLFSVFFFYLATFAQDSAVGGKKAVKDQTLPRGNAAFEEKNYAEAEADYRISQSKFSKNAKPSYNLGNAIYRQKQPAEAKYQFAKAIRNAKTKPEKHQAFHNLGNCLMTEKDYQGAVDAYKNALRNNPQDEETRYNYALAKLYLKNHPPKKDGKNKDKDKKDDKKDDKDKDKNKDNQNDKDKDKDKNKDKKDDKGQPDKNKEGDNDKNKKDDKGQGQPKENPGGMSKQRLESLLDAVNNEEKKVQDKVNLQKVKANPKKTDKDW